MPKLHLRRLTVWLALALFALPTAAADLAVIDVNLHPAPDAERQDGVTVIIRDGRIHRTGRDLDTGTLPVVDGGGRVATAGLWNCHVHLTDPAVIDDPQSVLRDMLLRYGFTSMVDTGSDPAVTRRIRAQIQAGELDGPRIVTAGGGFVYTDGTPSYLPEFRLPEIAAADEAAPAVNQVLDAGADGIKIFSGSFQSPTETILLPPDVIRAITAAAHARNGFVISHPTNRPGLVNAVHNGVDVLAHTAPQAGALEPELLGRMLDARVGLIPTLKLWSYELGRAGYAAEDIRRVESAAVGQLRAYAAAGGEILFGTDVGYMSDFDPTDEYRLMTRAGMAFPAMLAALTTNPARRFAGESGRVEPGAPGDLVLFEHDPAADPAAFTTISHTIRGGRVIHARTH